MKAACPTHAETRSPIARPLAWARALRRLLAPLLAVWLALAAGWAVAADGVVIALVGSVVAERTDSAAPATRALSVGSELSQGDLVRTGKDGRAQIRFSDGGLVSLQPGTDFRIDEYRFDAATERSFFSLLRGALRSATGAIGKRDRENYRLRTPTATIGIRGTEFLAEETVCTPLCAPGSRAGLKVSVTQGRIAVTTRAGTLEVGEGQSAEVESPDAMPRLAAAGPILGPIALPTIGAATTAVASSAGATSSTDSAATTTGTTASPSAAAGSTEKSAVGAGAAAAAAGGASADGETMPLADRTWPGPTAATSAPTPTGGGTATDTSGEPDLADAAAGQFLDEPPPEVGDSISANVRRDDDGGLLVLAGALPPAAGIPTPPADPADPTDPTDPPDEPGPVPVQAFVSVRTPEIPGVSALQFDSRDAQPQFDEAQALSAIGTCPSFCLSRGSAKAVETGFEADVVAWGRWTGGTATLQTGASSLRTVELGPDQGIHYLIGAPSQTVPTSGSFSYSLIGATSPTLAGGGVAPGQFAGSAAVWFGPGEPARIGIDATLTIGGSRVGFATTGGAADPAASQLRTGAQFGFAGTLGASVAGGDPAGCGNTGCTVDLRGGLFGNDAARLGFTYSVEGNDASRAIGGAAVFGKQ